MKMRSALMAQVGIMALLAASAVTVPVKFVPTDKNGLAMAWSTALADSGKGGGSGRGGDGGGSGRGGDGGGSHSGGGSDDGGGSRLWRRQ